MWRSEVRGVHEFTVCLITTRLWILGWYFDMADLGVPESEVLHLGMVILPLWVSGVQHCPRTWGCTRDEFASSFFYLNGKGMHPICQVWILPNQPKLPPGLANMFFSLEHVKQNVDILVGVAGWAVAPGVCDAKVFILGSLQDPICRAAGSIGAGGSQIGAMLHRWSVGFGRFTKPRCFDKRKGEVRENKIVLAGEQWSYCVYCERMWKDWAQEGIEIWYLRRR